MVKVLFLSIVLTIFSYAKKPNLLLLKVYKDQNITGWLMSEKLDGIRAYWNGKELLTRGGKIIHAPKWFTQNYPPFPIDGELWSKRGDFENISSIVRDKIPNEQEWRQINHYIFEVPNANGGLLLRLQKVKQYEGKIIKIIPQYKIESKSHLKQFLKSIEDQGGEGVVVRDPNAPYIAKRTSKALKVKSFLDDECKVISINKGHGKFKELMGSITCKLDNNTTFKIGSGFNFNNRKKPPTIGSKVTFKYKEVTKNGKPRFPVFLRVRSAK